MSLKISFGHILCLESMTKREVFHQFVWQFVVVRAFQTFIIYSVFDLLLKCLGWFNFSVSGLRWGVRAWGFHAYNSMFPEFLDAWKHPEDPMSEQLFWHAVTVVSLVGEGWCLYHVVSLVYQALAL